MNPLDPTLRELDDCGCSSGTSAETPATIDNRPGLDVVAFRIGTHQQFKATMLDALTDAGRSALSKLKTRDDDDPTIALIDACATVADVLSFYSERIANEAFLRTATERRSVLELARSLGYELNPGVAAQTWVAFTIEDTDGAPGYATIDAGAKVQSIPGPNERPQVYETVQPLLARKEWNKLRPQASAFTVPFRGMSEVRLAGTTTNLKEGDWLLIVGDERKQDSKSESWDARRIIKIATVADADPNRSYTAVTLHKKLGFNGRPTEPAKRNPRVYAFRQRAALFGANAPEWKTMPKDVKDMYDPQSQHRAADSDWPDFTIDKVSTLTDENKEIHLDAIYPAIVPENPPGTPVRDSWIVISTAPDGELYAVKEVGEDAPAKFTLTGKSTRLKLSGEHLKEKFNDKIRQTVVLIQSDLLSFAEDPITTPLSGDEILLDRVLDPPLAIGSALIVESLLPQNGGTIAETVVLKRIEQADATHTKLVLVAPLTLSHQPTTTTIYANVAKATHGETVREVLGSGDANQSHQRFVLKQTPLTYTRAANVSGSEISLEVWVDDVKWREVPSLYAQGRRARVYVVRIADDGHVTVQFGDGANGARLPTGRENIRAVYRKGIGQEGTVKARQLALLMTRPLGVKSVVNPIAADGGIDPQAVADARSNAPITVLTLGRVVSLQDYEDFARSRTGIAKALATWTWNVHTRGVLLTIADLAPGTAGRDTLRTALRDLGNPLVPIDVQPYTPVSFKLAGTVFVETDHDPEKVSDAVKCALRNKFGFDARSFGQSVTLSEVIAVIQNVDGVSFVDLDALYIGNTSARASFLPAHTPSNGAAANLALPAELLTLDETSLTSLIVKPVPDQP